MSFVDLSPIEQMYSILDRLSDDAMWFHAMQNPKMKLEIERMNTIDQLYNQGIDSKGRSLGDYSPYTVMIKQSDGQRYDHITLNDTGAFYRSFTVVVDRDGLTIDADDSSRYDVPLLVVYGEDVLGLTSQNMQKLIDIVRDEYIEYLWNEIFS